MNAQRITAALADLDNVANILDIHGMNLNAHAVRRSVRTLRAELVPPVLDPQEDDGDPEITGEWPDLMFVVRPS